MWLVKNLFPPQIKCFCDILRIRWESARSRTKERALLMMDKLVWGASLLPCQLDLLKDIQLFWLHPFIFPLFLLYVFQLNAFCLPFFNCSLPSEFVVQVYSSLGWEEILNINTQIQTCSSTYVCMHTLCAQLSSNRRSTYSNPLDATWAKHGGQ